MKSSGEIIKKLFVPGINSNISFTGIHKSFASYERACNNIDFAVFSHSRISTT